MHQHPSTLIVTIRLAAYTFYLIRATKRTIQNSHIITIACTTAIQVIFSFFIFFRFLLQQNCGLKTQFTGGNRAVKASQFPRDIDNNVSQNP